MDITKLQVELNPIDKEVFNVQFRDIETGKVVLELNKAKVTIEGIVDCSRPQVEIYDGSVSGTIDFIFEKDIDKGNNLFTVRIEDK